MSSIRISNNEARSRRRCFLSKFLRIRRNQWRIASRRCRGEDSPRCHGSFAIRVSRHASTNASNNSICIRAASSRTIPRGSFVSIRRGLPRRVALHRVSKQYVKRARVYARRTKPWMEWLWRRWIYRRGGWVFARFRETWKALWLFGSISGLYARGHAIVRFFFFFVDQRATATPYDECRNAGAKSTRFGIILSVNVERWNASFLWNAAF